MNPPETAQDILAEALEFRGVVTGEVRDAFRRRMSYALMVEMSEVVELWTGGSEDEEEWIGGSEAEDDERRAF